MIIGASEFEFPAYELAKKIGIKLIMTDVNPNCSSFKYADEQWVVSASEPEQVVQCFKKSEYTSDIIFAYCGNDFGTESAIEVNSLIFGSDSVTGDGRKFGNNKLWMKELFVAHAISTPQYVCLKKDDFERPPQNIHLHFDYPVVCKPHDSSGARGVTVVHFSNKIEEAIQKAFAFSDKILIEEYIPGTHLDMNGFMVDRTFYRAGTSDRFFLPEPSRVSLKNFAPSTHNPAILEQAWTQLQKAAEALGLFNGPIKADFIVDDEGIPYLLETSFRFHGGLTSCGSMAFSGTSFALFDVLAVLDKNIQKGYAAHWQPKSSVGCTHIIPDFMVAEDVDVPNYSIPENLPGVGKIYIRENVVGRKGGKLQDNTNILGYIISSGSTREECELYIANALLNMQK